MNVKEQHKQARRMANDCRSAVPSIDPSRVPITQTNRQILFLLRDLLNLQLNWLGELAVEQGNVFDRRIGLNESADRRERDVGDVGVVRQTDEFQTKSRQVKQHLHALVRDPIPIQRQTNQTFVRLENIQQIFDRTICQLVLLQRQIFQFAILRQTVGQVFDPNISDLIIVQIKTF